MFWTIIALVMTVLMGGIIAYNGDLIGRKFGKRRVSLFNLRPKHTAILITSVTGVLISLMTTVVMFLLLPPVRRVILEGENALRSLSRLQTRQKGLERQITQSEEKLRHAEGELSAIRKDREKERQDLARIRTALSQATRQLVDARAELGDARTERDSAVRARNEALSARRNLLAQIGRLRSQRVALLKRNRDLLASNTELSRRNRDLGVKLQGLTAEISRQVAMIDDQARQIKQGEEYAQEISQQNEAAIREKLRLEQEREALIRIRVALDQGNEELQKKNVELARQNENLIRERRSLVNANEELTVEGTRASEGLASVANRLVAVRTGRVVVHRGEELSRRTLSGGAGAVAVRDEIRRLLQDADAAAKGRGAAAREGDGERAFHIARKVVVSQTPLGPREMSLETEAEHVTALAGALSESESAVCLMTVAVANTVESEPAIVEIRPVMNPLVYARGGEVARRLVNTQQPAEKVFTDLVEFIKDVGRTAIERGIIPRMDSASGEPQVGALDWPELVRVVEQARSRGRMVPNRKVTVVARAQEDTYAAGPLKLEFKVEYSPAGINRGARR